MELIPGVVCFTRGSWEMVGGILKRKRVASGDLGSFNGSFVNNLLVTEHALRAGDRVQLGSTVLYFEPDDGTAGAAPKASASARPKKALISG